MNEIEVSKLEELEIARLYEAIQEVAPGTEEYDNILKAITDIRKAYNENSKIEQAYWTADENRKHEAKIAEENRLHEENLKKKEICQRYVDTAVRALEFIGSTAVGAIMTWSVVNANIKWSPMQCKDGFQMAQKLFKNFKL